MEMTTPSARVQIRRVSELRNPAVCAQCGNGTCLKGYVDPDIFFEYEGNIYICMNCAEEIAQAIGCLLPAESAHLEELNLTIAQELRETKEKLAAYEQFDNLIHQYFGRNIAATADSTSGSPASDAEPNAAEQSVDITEPVSVPDAGEPEPAKPATKQGPVRPRNATAGNKPKLNI